MCDTYVTISGSLALDYVFHRGWPLMMPVAVFCVCSINYGKDVRLEQKF